METVSSGDFDNHRKEVDELTKNQKFINGLTLKEQAELRDTGLLADAHEPYVTPDGIRLDAMPKAFDAKRRQRSDRITKGDLARIGLTEKKGRK